MEVVYARLVHSHDTAALSCVWVSFCNTGRNLQTCPSELSNTPECRSVDVGTSNTSSRITQGRALLLQEHLLPDNPFSHQRLHHMEWTIRRAYIFGKHSFFLADANSHGPLHCCGRNYCMEKKDVYRSFLSKRSVFYNRRDSGGLFMCFSEFKLCLNPMFSCHALLFQKGV